MAKRVIGVMMVLWLFQASQLTASDTMEKMAGGMLMVGFYGTSAEPDSQICQDIRRYDLAGVILFDFNPVDKSKPKNISSKQQLEVLTEQLQKCSKDGKLLISVDQEGGRVQRLKAQYGFAGNFPVAADVHKMDRDTILEVYGKMARELGSVGINYDLAPVVDLDINQKNHVIHELGRSFGRDPKEVAKYASLFMEAMHKGGILTSLKHFPGHGSSLGDTHKGFVDVTNLWQKEELEPYKLLAKKADSVMVAHVYNANLDAQYPATLSAKIINGMLRKKLGYQGVVITDDMQMGAIGQKYGLRERIKLAINAGDDILLFGNQLDPKHTVSTKVLVDTIVNLMNSREVDTQMVKKANERVAKLKQKLKNH
jgi:beta-N-acetylhexosaminidase